MEENKIEGKEKAEEMKSGIQELLNTTAQPESTISASEITKAFNFANRHMGHQAAGLSAIVLWQD